MQQNAMFAAQSRIVELDVSYKKFDLSAKTLRAVTSPLLFELHLMSLNVFCNRLRHWHVILFLTLIVRRT